MRQPHVCPPWCIDTDHRRDWDGDIPVAHHHAAPADLTYADPDEPHLGEHTVTVRLARYDRGGVVGSPVVSVDGPLWDHYLSTRDAQALGALILAAARRGAEANR